MTGPSLLHPMGITRPGMVSPKGGDWKDRKPSAPKKKDPVITPDPERKFHQFETKEGEELTLKDCKRISYKNNITAFKDAKGHRYVEVIKRGKRVFQRVRTSGEQNKRKEFANREIAWRNMLQTCYFFSAENYNKKPSGVGEREVVKQLKEYRRDLMKQQRQENRDKKIFNEMGAW